MAAGGVLGTLTIAAWRAYDAGHVALAGWDLPEAAKQFGLALEKDPGYGLAHAWLAQTLAWQGEPAEVWREHVLAGLGATLPLQPREREWVLALAALAESRFQEACDRYSRMITRDSLDFRAWYGRAECQAKDPLVLADAKSPTDGGSVPAIRLPSGTISTHSLSCPPAISPFEVPPSPG